MSDSSVWQYSADTPAPTTPAVVSTVQSYFAGLPTPPDHRPGSPCATPTPTVDVHTSPAPTPRCVVVSLHRDEKKCSNTLDPVTSELDKSPVFADPLASDHSFDDVPTLHVSDCLIYARQLYAYPSPILTMIKRASLDQRGLRAQLVDPQVCGKPFKMFSLTAGIIPLTGLKERDDQSFDYYLVYDLSLLTVPKRSVSYTFSIGAIQALQHDLSTLWHAVYPEPFPPVIIHSRDLIGPYHLSRRENGHAYVVPTEDSVWATICRRGIDVNFRPLDRSATVETGFCQKGDAIYHPQHVVASKFVVNVFLELPNDEIGLCEYLGAYVLQVVKGLTMRSFIWADVDPQVKQSVFNRVPHLFKRSKHPPLPFVKFRYYHWDPCVIQLAKQSMKIIIPTNQGSTDPPCKRIVDQGAASTPEHTSSPCG